MRAYFEHSRASHLVDASLAPIHPCGLGSIRLARMRIELAHRFVCTAQALPKLKDLFGSVCARDLQISIPDTALRTGVLSFRMIELLWVSNAQEAQSEDPRRTLLWEVVWSGR